MRRRFGHRGAITLIELLVAAAVAGTLSGVVAPNVGRLVRSARAEAVSNELHEVQTGLNAYLTQQGLSSVPAQPFATHDLSRSTPALYPAHLERNPLRCAYAWDSAGQVAQSCP